MSLSSYTTSREIMGILEKRNLNLGFFLFYQSTIKLNIRIHLSIYYIFYPLLLLYYLFITITTYFMDIYIKKYYPTMYTDYNFFPVVETANSRNDMSQSEIFQLSYY